MTIVRRLVPWFVAAWLVPAMVSTALVSAFAFFEEDPARQRTSAMTLDELVTLMARVVLPAAMVAIVVVAIGLSSASYSPRRAARWLAALLVGIAVEHALLAIVVLARGIISWEGAIVLSAPVFVIAGLGVGLGVLRGRAWARPALILATVPMLGWALYIAGIVSDLAFRTPTFAPGIGLHLAGVFAGLIAIAAAFGAAVLRMPRPNDR